MKGKKTDVAMKPKQAHMLEKSKAKSEHKTQGQRAPAKHLKNGGDAFAYGLSGIMEEQQAQKGSQGEFLGVKSQALDPSKYVRKDRLHDTGKK
jgi:hypothetical protein